MTLKATMHWSIWIPVRVLYSCFVWAWRGRGPRRLKRETLEEAGDYHPKGWLFFITQTKGEKGFCRGHSRGRAPS